MKLGDDIRGYRILRDFSTAGGGLSKWSFAERDGEEFFIKEFLSPTYPDSKSPGSEATKARKRERCRIFEDHHNKLIAEISPACAEGGNLIATKAFFRHGTKYYKVTEKVDVTGLTPNQISRLEIEKRLLILKTVAHSLGVLHKRNIVHGDLKPDNILIKQTATGNYTAKLIDFDNSYFSGKPPELLEDVVGDMVYYSPELALYIKGADSIKSADLQVKSDIFALGLIYNQYMNGSLPRFDTAKYQYPHQAVLAGEKLKIDKIESFDFLSPLLEEMLNADIAKRPTINEVFERLKASGKEKEKIESTGTLKIRMLGRSDAKSAEIKPEKSSDNPITGKLKIRMGGKTSGK